MTSRRYRFWCRMIVPPDRLSRRTAIAKPGLECARAASSRARLRAPRAPAPCGPRGRTRRRPRRRCLRDMPSDRLIRPGSLMRETRIRGWMSSVIVSSGPGEGERFDRGNRRSSLKAELAQLSVNEIEFDSDFSVAPAPARGPRGLVLCARGRGRVHARERRRHGGAGHARRPLRPGTLHGFGTRGPGRARVLNCTRRTPASRSQSAASRRRGRRPIPTSSPSSA